MFDYFEIAESGIGSYRHPAILRWSLVIVFVWFGTEKFTDYAAGGIAPLIANSPIVSWLQLFGVQGEARIVGTIELTTAAVLSIGAFQATLSALGSAQDMAASQYGVNLTPDQMSTISNQLMNADLATRENSSYATTMTPQQISDYHIAVFDAIEIGDETMLQLSN